ncbi:MAG: recombinase family protein [Cytophagales bacterium]|nr:recombinase family protein [Cytophagales bacterium]
MRIGYARVSTKDQKLEMQLEALEEHGCELIFKEKKSAAKERPELDKMLAQLRKEDQVVVWKLDRLGRSLRHLVNLINKFNETGVQFVSLNDNIDTTTAQGRLMFNLFASFAEFERELISERTKAGLANARAKGRKGGRRPGLSKESQEKAWCVMRLLDTRPDMSAQDIQKEVGISKGTYYRYIDWAEKESKELSKKYKKRKV